MTSPFESDQNRRLADEWRGTIDKHVRMAHARAVVREPFRMMLPALSYGVAGDKPIDAEVNRVRALLYDLNAALPDMVPRPKFEVCVTDAIAKGQGPGVVIYSDRPREDNAEIRSATEETISK